MATSSLKLALIQLAVTANKAENLSRAAKFIVEAASNGANIVALPECFNSPYGIKYFKEYAEAVPTGESSQVLSSAAKQNKIYLIGGSLPEIDGDKIYNTCTVWGPNGDLLAKHRKMHLFDINIPGKITFEESKALMPGDTFTKFSTDQCPIGIGICYDLRFAAMAQIYAQEGCKLLVYPGAFNMTTGPDHWELLQRGRALDNQLFVATVSPARSKDSGYVAWGHSMVIDPWGKVLVQAHEEEEIVYADLDLNYLEEVRSQIPITKQFRKDLYEVKRK